jgi:hypothetical protein
MTALLIAATLAAAAEPCLERARATAERLRPDFPALAGKTLSYSLYDGETDFYRAYPLKPWRSPAARVYEVRVSRRACADPPPREAEEAVLTHELAHLDAFARLGPLRLARLGLAYWLAPEGEAVAAHERAMDAEVVARGRAPGLARYREWMYPRVGPAAAAVKRRLYLTPEELAGLDAGRKKR